VKAEEYDWKIYHIIAAKKGCQIEEICEMSGFSHDIVQESLDRMTSYLLIESRGDLFLVCTIEQYLITSQMKHDPFSNIIIENGVVKVKKMDNPDQIQESGEK
jgi:hypothetical protein